MGDGADPAPATAQAGPAPWLQFICRVCGLIYDEAKGDPDSGLAPGTRFADIPEDWACPICGVGKADFEPHHPTGQAGAARPLPLPHARGPQRAQRPGRAAGVVVVGAGRAGWQVVQALRERGWAAPITLVAACSGDVYDKPQLSVAVARGLPVDGLVRESATDAASRLGVRLLCDTQAVAIDAPRQRLRTTRGPLDYQHLVLAHGALPALPAELSPQQVWRINDLAAYRRLRQALAGGPQRLAIVGAGLVGCELANDLALAGHSVTLLDLQPHPLAAVLPQAVGQGLLAAWQGLPIRFAGGLRVLAMARGAADPQGRATWQLALSDGSTLQAHQVIAATGLRTPGRLAASAGLAYDAAAGGLVVDAATGATSRPGVYALGDCAVVGGRASRFIEPIRPQAEAIACAILGLPPPQRHRPSAAEPVLRVKTSSWPITLTRHAAGSGTWQPIDAAIEGQPVGPGAMRLVLRSPQGDWLATLVAGAVAAGNGAAPQPVAVG